tara:strand:+ start:2150 stop:2827 length:678 start_codon:yes stop_codon:yes gene_type:complete
MKKNIANLVTLTSLCLAIMSIIQSCNLNFTIASTLILTCFFLDGLDGFVARYFKIASNFGKQLDSFSDMIAFGLAPGILMYNFIAYEFHNTTLSYIALLIPVCSALRLSKYNIDSTQSTIFSGLTTPANAIFFSAIPLIRLYEKSDWITNILIQPATITFLILIMSILLISPIKTLNLRIELVKNDQRKMLFIVISIVILSIFNFTGILIIIFIYIITSMLKYMN